MLKDKDELSLGMHLFCWSFISFDCNLSLLFCRKNSSWANFWLEKPVPFLCQILLIPSHLSYALSWPFILFSILFFAAVVFFLNFFLNLYCRILWMWRSGSSSFQVLVLWCFHFTSLSCSLEKPLTLSDECSFIWFFILVSWKERRKEKRRAVQQTLGFKTFWPKRYFSDKMDEEREREQKENKDRQRVKRLEVGVHDLLKVSWQPWMKSESEWLSKGKWKKEHASILNWREEEKHYNQFLSLDTFVQCVCLLWFV